MRYTIAAAVAAIALQTSFAQADTIVALSGDSLEMIDSKSGKVSGKTKIKGVSSVVGIDVRPADGQLYALASDGTIATVDAKSGQATAKSKLDTPLPTGVKMTVDFNPVADRLRVIGSDGTNLRINVDDGKVTKDQPLKFAEADAGGKTPMVIAGGYINSMKGAKETTLYDIDGTSGGLFRQAPPNDGVLNKIGMLGIDAKNASFDIMTDAAGTNTAVLLSGKKLYTVDLASGKTTATKDISGLSGDVTDIAAMPAM